MTLLFPTVISFLPLGVYDVNVGPGASGQSLDHVALKGVLIVAHELVLLLVLP